MLKTRYEVDLLPNISGVLLKKTWWQNLKDQFCTHYKKSSSTGSGRVEQNIIWKFYKEMSFMKCFIYTGEYLVLHFRREGNCSDEDSDNTNNNVADNVKNEAGV